MLNKMDKEQQKEHLITIMKEDAENGLYYKRLKQTAVEWLEDVYNTQGRILPQQFEQAKEMDKQKTMFDYSAGVIEAMKLDGNIDCHKYWNEYYGGNNEQQSTNSSRMA